MNIRPAVTADLEYLAALAALTFPLAAPDDSAPESLAIFIAQHLSVARFKDHLLDPAVDLLVHQEPGTGEAVTGYLMLVAGEPADAAVADAITVRPTIQLSKFYVAPESHGRGMAGWLMAAAFAAAEARKVRAMWLGVNRENIRAQRFYAKQGFEQVGTKRFAVGERLEHDFVLQRTFPSR